MSKETPLTPAETFFPSYELALPSAIRHLASTLKKDQEGKIISSKEKELEKAFNFFSIQTDNIISPELCKLLLLGLNYKIADINLIINALKELGLFGNNIRSSTHFFKSFLYFFALNAKEQPKGLANRYLRCYMEQLLLSEEATEFNTLKKYCNSKDLSLFFSWTTFLNKNFSNFNLANVTFGNINLVNCNFSRAQLNNAYFHNATLTKCNFEKGYGIETEFSTCSLEDCNFSGAILPKINFGGSTLKNVDFTDASLNNALFKPYNDVGVSLKKVKFIRTALENAYFSPPKIERTNLAPRNTTDSHIIYEQDQYIHISNTFDVDFSEANLKSARIGGLSEKKPIWLEKTNLQKASCLEKISLSHIQMGKLDLSHKNLSDATLWDVNLSQVNLTHTNCTNTKLNDCSLATLPSSNFTNAELNNCRLVKADLKHSNFTHTKLNTCNLVEANLKHSNFTHAKLNTCNLVKADLKHSNFTHAKLNTCNLVEADLKHSNFTGASLIAVRLMDFTSRYLSPREKNSFSYKANFAKIKKTNFTNATLENVSFSASIMQKDNTLYQEHLPLKDVTFTDCQLKEISYGFKETKKFGFGGFFKKNTEVFHQNLLDEFIQLLKNYLLGNIFVGTMYRHYTKEVTQALFLIEGMKVSGKEDKQLVYDALNILKNMFNDKTPPFPTSGSLRNALENFCQKNFSQSFNQMILKEPQKKPIANQMTSKKSITEMNLVDNEETPTINKR